MFFSCFKLFQDEISYLSRMQFDWFFIFSDPKIPKIPREKEARCHASHALDEGE